MTINFEKGLKQTGLPIIECNIKGHDEPFCFVIDTGADYSRVFDFVRYGLPQCFTSSGKTESTIDINGCQQEGEIVNAYAEIDGKEYLLNFVVIDVSPIVMMMHEQYGIKLCGVLGNDFLFAGQFKLDFKNSCITD